MCGFAFLPGLPGAKNRIKSIVCKEDVYWNGFLGLGSDCKDVQLGQSCIVPNQD